MTNPDIRSDSASQATPWRQFAPGRWQHGIDDLAERFADRPEPQKQAKTIATCKSPQDKTWTAASKLLGS
jgi:hypothetical protein